DETGKGVFLLLPMVAQGHPGDGAQAEAQLSGVQARRIAFDEAGRFQRRTSPGALGGGKVHDLGQSRAGAGAVLLQRVQDRTVEPVYAHCSRLLPSSWRI